MRTHVMLLALSLALGSHAPAYAGWTIGTCLGCNGPGLVVFATKEEACQVTAQINGIPFHSAFQDKPLGRLECLRQGDPPRGFAQGAQTVDCPPEAPPSKGVCQCPANKPVYDAGYGVCLPPGTDPRDPKNNGGCVGCVNPPVADPISPGTLNNHQRHTDYEGGGPFPLRFERHYNSNRGPVATIGTLWQHTYARRLISSTGLLAFRPDGQVRRYVPNGELPDMTSDRDNADRLSWIRGSDGGVAGYRLQVASDDSTEEYDPSGRLLRITNRQGLAQTMTYSDAQTLPATAPWPFLLIRVADSFGRELNLTYDEKGRVATLRDPEGQTYSYAYDANHNLTTVRFPDGKTRSYHYEHPVFVNALTAITDENAQRYVTWSYDASGHAVANELAGGVARYELTTSTVRDPFNQLRGYQFDVQQGLYLRQSVSVPPCPSCGPASMGFDLNSNLAFSRDWNGNRTNYVHDLTRNLQTSRTEGLAADGTATPQIRSIHTQWHATYRLATRIAEPLRITTNVYGDAHDPNPGNRGSLLSRTIHATTDASGVQGFSATPIGSPRTWTYTYNTHGQVLSADGPRTDAADVTTYTYDPQGNLATVTNAAGHRTDITAYNLHGQPLTLVDPNGLTTKLAYDARQRLISRTVGGETTAYDYDAAGQLKTVKQPDGSFLAYMYDAAHRLTGMEDSAGNRIAYTLDTMGNRIREEVFDPANALAQKRSRTYSNLNRLFQLVGAQNQTSEYAYDNQGNVVSVKDPLNRVTTNQYDALNRLRQVTDAAKGITQYAYNGLDALTRVTDPRSLVTRYTIDGLGNLTLQSSPDTGETASAHDDAGNLLTQTDAKGQVTSYRYDAINRVTRITFHDGSTQAYAYDQGSNGIGRLSSITETDPTSQLTSIITYSYSLHGRVLSETRTVAGVSYVTAYSYDSAGRIAAMTYPSGRSTAYTYDALGRIGAIRTTFNGQSESVVSSVAYHPFGGVKSYTLGNGQVYARSYDQDGRIASYSLGAKTFGIGYDAASRIEFISEFANPANSSTYGYDALDRLTSATTPGTPYTYSYDEVGNRLGKTAGVGTETLTYSPTSNRIASFTPASGPERSFVFDANGSNTDDGSNTYAYDVRGRMVSSTSAIGISTYQVNALGQRVRKTSRLGDVVFHYDSGGRLIGETSPGGAFKREILYLGDIPVGVVQ